MKQQMLAGRTAIVTGATSGIGKAVAQLFAQEGCAVVLSGRRGEVLSAVQQQITQAGGQCAGVVGDGADPLLPQKLLAAAEGFGGADVLVCSAGVALRTPTLEVTRQQWQSVMDINLTFPMQLSCAWIDRLLQQGRAGKIVFISSTAAKSVNMGASPSYGASKAGLVYLTRHLATEFGGRGIHVNAICPGPVDTEITHTWTPEHRQRVLASLPLGRMGTPEDIAQCALFLASGMSDYINGESILVNGGRFMD